MGIICETDYFGLLYAPVPGASSSLSNEKQWINLRNPLQRRHSNDRTLLLELRVKFWVPGHLILQESVRDIFYSQARQKLFSGQLSANDWPNAAKLSALLAQADGVKFSAFSLKENYKELNEILTRMQADKESELSQQNKRRRPSKRKSSESEREDQRTPSLSSLACSPSCQIVCNDYDASTTMHGSLKNYLNYIVRPQFEADNCEDNEMPENFLMMIAKEHEKMASHHMTTASAKYWLLEEIGLLKKFGEEMFDGGVVMHSSESKSQPHQPNSIKIGVSPHGLVVYKEKQEKFR